MGSMFVLCALWGVGDGEVRLQDLSFQARDITRTVQPSMKRLTLLPQPAAAIRRKPDADVTAWGSMTLGPRNAARTITLAVQEKPGAKPAVWADADADGDLTDDPAVEVEVVLAPDGAMQMYRGQFVVSVPKLSDTPLSVRFHRFSPAEAVRRKLPADVLFCYADYGYTGKLVVGDRQYPILMTDEQASGDYSFEADRATEDGGITMFVDANRNGAFEPPERYRGNETIALDDAAVVVESVSADGRDVKLAPASRGDPRIRPPAMPNLEPGHKALAFAAKALDGGQIKFPEAYKGKLVLLDFWATWCGPCVAEIPTVAKAYEKYHNNGFDVLGVCLDKPGGNEGLVKFLNERKMLWRQIYPGNDVANLWVASSIPRMYIIDGDTGEILAGGAAIRGEGLDPAIQAAMKKKYASGPAGKK